MDLNREKIAALEEVARGLNESGFRWAVTNGLDDYPDTIGRDLDIIVEGSVELVVRQVIKVLEASGWVVLPNRQGWIWWVVAFRKNPDGSLDSLQVDLFEHLQWAFTWVVDEVGEDETLVQRGPFHEDPGASVAKRFLLHALSTGVTKFRENPRYLELSDEELGVLPQILARLSGREWPELVGAVSKKDLDLLERELLSFRKSCFLKSIWSARPIARLASAFQKQWVVNLFPQQGAPVIALTSDHDSASQRFLEEIAGEFRKLVFQDVRVVNDSATKIARHWRRLSCLQVVLIFVNTPVPAGLKAEITAVRDKENRIYWKAEGLDSRSDQTAGEGLGAFLMRFFESRSRALKERHHFTTTVSGRQQTTLSS